jgi:hypothetical protein
MAIHHTRRLVVVVVVVLEELRDLPLPDVSINSTGVPVEVEAMMMAPR